MLFSDTDTPHAAAPRKPWTTPVVIHAQLAETEKPYDPVESANPGFGPS